ncbi:MAG: hypothetical protein KBA91_02170 [Candidatus Moranbacteria bacterium]|jgi:hypothetical protein|nr:hypothetical protein [Candidatus Moranbacteria bacterium]
MQIDRDDVLVSGGRELCASTFPEVHFERIPTGDLRARITLKNAMGEDRFFGENRLSFVSDECAYSEFCLAVAQALPMNLERAPHEVSSIRWSAKSPQDRAMIHLHALFELASSRGYRIQYFELLLRALEHAAKLKLTFEVENAGFKVVTISVGSLGKDHTGHDLGMLTIRVSLPSNLDIFAEFVPIPAELKN